MQNGFASSIFPPSLIAPKTVESISLGIQLAAILAAFLLGLFTRKGGVKRSIILGFFSNMIAQVGLMGGGSGAWAGMFLLPIYCIGLMFLGRAVGRVVRALWGQIGRTA